MNLPKCAAGTVVALSAESFSFDSLGFRARDISDKDELWKPLLLKRWVLKDNKIRHCISLLPFLTYDLNSMLQRTLETSLRGASHTMQGGCALVHLERYVQLRTRSVVMARLHSH